MSTRAHLRDRPLLLILAAVVMQAVVQGFMTEDVGPSDSLVFSAWPLPQLRQCSAASIECVDANPFRRDG